MVWAITTVLGFWVAYCPAFHVRAAAMQMVPLLTSSIIRMIPWRRPGRPRPA